MTRREAWPLVDWLPPEDSDFPERDAEILAVLTRIRETLDEIYVGFGIEYSEAAHAVEVLRDAIFGRRTGVWIEVDDDA